METPHDTTGDAPSQDQEPAAAASSPQVADSPTGSPPSDTAPPGETPQDPGLTLIEVNAFLKTTAAATTTQPAAPKPAEGKPETGREPAPGSARTAEDPKEKLRLEIQDLAQVLVLDPDNLVVNISSKVTEFLPYDHEASSSWWLLKHLMEWVLFVCLTSIFVGLRASKVLESSRIWNLEGWRLCLMIYLVLGGWIVAKWVVEVVGFLADHLVIDLLRVIMIEIKIHRTLQEEIINGKEEVEELKELEARKVKEEEEKLKEHEARKVKEEEAKLKELEARKVVEEYFDNVALVAQGMRGITRVLLWIASLLVAWTLLFTREKEVARLPHHMKEDLKKVTRALIATLVGVFLWGLKTLLVRLLAWSFIVKKSVKDVEATCKNQHQIVEIMRVVNQSDQQQPSLCTSRSSKHSFRNWVNLPCSMEKSGSGLTKGRRVLKREYDVITNVRREWTPGYLIRKITERELPVFIEGQRLEAKSVSVQRIARATADWLFGEMVKFCVKHSPGGAEGDEVRYIKKANMPIELAKKLEKMIPMVVLRLDGSQRFRRSDFRKWMINVYKERLVLIRVINGRDNVIGELNRTFSCVAALVILFVWLLIMRSLTVQVMISIVTLLGTLKFIFDDTARTAFEATMFVFATRPFDVGSRCQVGEKEMIVHDMNILSTIFKKVDGQILYYPNSALIKSTIINCRSDEEDRGETLEFKIDASVIANNDDPVHKLRDEIEKYMEKSKIWNTEKCKMKVKKSENLLILIIRPKANFYHGADKKTHKEELVEKIEKKLEKLKLSATSNCL